MVVVVDDNSRQRCALIDVDMLIRICVYEQGCETGALCDC